MRKNWLPWICLIGLSVAFRYPVLANAHELNSDVAIVGIQARHMLAGEFSWFLLGSGYQSSVDSLWAALCFKVFGATPQVLLSSALALHVVLTCLVHAMLRRRLSSAPWTAFALSCLLIFCTASVHSYALYPPRQAALTLAFGALYAADRAPDMEHPFGGYVACGLLAGLSCFADPYAQLLYPVSMGLAALSFVEMPGRRLRATFALGAAAVVGLLPNIWLRQLPSAQNAPLGLSTDVIARNWHVLVDVCAPWALGFGTYAPTAAGPYALIVESPLIRYAEMLAAGLFLAACASGVAFALSPRIPLGVRRLGVAGACGVFGTFAAFLLSTMVLNHFSMRYLATVTLCAPLAMAPLGYCLGRHTAWLLLPITAAMGHSGYLSFGEYVAVQREDGTLAPVGVVTAEDDRKLLAALREAHVAHAMADYWSAYRLAFIAAESPFFVPKNAAEDRYGVKRAEFTLSSRVAYVYDARRSLEGPAVAEREARALGRIVSRQTVGAYTAYIVIRK